MNIAERAAAKQACRSMAFVCETSSEATQEACKAAIAALCGEFQVVQFGLMPEKNKLSNYPPIYGDAAPNAITAVMEWVKSADFSMRVALPLPSPAAAIAALSSVEVMGATPPLPGSIGPSTMEDQLNVDRKALARIEEKLSDFIRLQMACCENVVNQSLHQR